MSDHPAGTAPSQEPDSAEAESPKILRRTFKFGVGLSSLIFVGFFIIWLNAELCSICHSGFGETLLLATGAFSFAIALLGGGYLLVGDDDKSGLAHSWRETGDRRK